MSKVAVAHPPAYGAFHQQQQQQQHTTSIEEMSSHIYCRNSNRLFGMSNENTPTSTPPASPQLRSGTATPPHPLPRSRRLSESAGSESLLASSTTSHDPYLPLQSTLTWAHCEMARLGVDSVQMVLLKSIPTISYITPFERLTNRDHCLFAGQVFLELASSHEGHQALANLIYLVTGVAPLSVSGFRREHGYSLRVYFHTRQDLKTCEALLYRRVQFTRDNVGELGALVYSRVGHAPSDDFKMSYHSALPEPKRCFRFDVLRHNQDHH